MQIAWYERRTGVLSGARMKDWTRGELASVSGRLVAGELPKLRQAGVLVAWDDAGPHEWISVFAIDDMEIADQVLVRIELLAREIHFRGRGEDGSA